MLRNFCLTLLACIALAACVSGSKPTDSYTDKSGKTTSFQTSHEQCSASCNADYTRCMDKGSAQNSPINGPAGMFGASADCREALKNCLTACKGR